MATRLYRCNPQDNDHTVTELAGSATTARIELTIDWDTLASDGLSGQQARLHGTLRQIALAGRLVERDGERLAIGDLDGDGASDVVGSQATVSLTRGTGHLDVARHFSA